MDTGRPKTAATHRSLHERARPPCGMVDSHAYSVAAYRGGWIVADALATGFLGATNIALAANGDIYVAELFAGKISVAHRGQVSTFLDLPRVVAVETYGGSVWAATMGDPGSQTPGTIVEVPRRRT